jgi:hypothetical protein
MFGPTINAIETMKSEIKMPSRRALLATPHHDRKWAAIHSAASNPNRDY